MYVIYEKASARESVVKGGNAKDIINLEIQTTGYRKIKPCRF
jgi:hypothetical protein